MAVTAEDGYVPVYHYATPPGEGLIRPPAAASLRRERPVWDSQIFGPMCSVGRPVTSVGFLQVGAGYQPQQPFDMLGTTPDYMTDGLATESGSWHSHWHQGSQESQSPSAPFGSLVHWPGLFWPFSPLPTASQPHLDSQGLSSAERRTFVGRKNAAPKTKRLKAAVEPSSTTPSSCDEISEQAYYDGRELESDLLPRPGEKKPYRINNRAAAKRCRDKMRQNELDLVAMDQQITEHRMYLEACVATLKDEVLGLKNEILQHSDCNCEAIKRYITLAASGVSLGKKTTAQGTLGR
ncbi:hypothetical protein LZ30DRAFT_693749 [Colletotrichum cereale]|nr:hypothetical protein LZ30DRAFT_693749 [Colletotrichum cereale]